LFGCDDSSGGTEIPPPPTMILVDPQQFDRTVACVDAPGGMRRYVATLIDVTESVDAALPQLPSSPPTPCTTPVGFGYVEPGRKYRAEIDGYDLDNLEALTAGNRLLRRRDTGELVVPRWRASCGNPLPGGDGESGDGGDLSFLEGPAEAFRNASVTVMGCTPFDDEDMTPQSASIRIDLSQALGDLQCGNAPGQIASYEVTVRDSTTSPSGASCASPITFDALDTNKTYFFDVTAFEAAPVSAGPVSVWPVSVGPGSDAGSDGGLSDAATPASLDAVYTDAANADAASTATARWRTSCYQLALAGVQQTAICEPLAPIP
jgi:hypothetical protein